MFPTVLILSIASCTHAPNSAYTPVDDAVRNTAQADRLNRQASELMASAPDRAETLLREALSFDLYHGPAHNNLGVLFLQQGKLYEAAGEFEWARKLLPGHPDPRLNLSLVLEKAGRIDDAIKNVQTALEVHPGHIASLQQLCRLELKYTHPSIVAGSQTTSAPSRATHGSDTQHRDDLRANLSAIALRGESTQWQDWAHQQLIRLNARP
ncbi:MAG: tetratricopeptide repeat protein [Planctomycetota bacterium]